MKVEPAMGVQTGLVFDVSDLGRRDRVMSSHFIWPAHMKWSQSFFSLFKYSNIYDSAVPSYIFNCVEEG